MNWQKLLQEIYASNFYTDLWAKVDLVYSQKKCFPAKEDIFKAFDLCPLENLKVVILGQDPYHNDFQANGLSFSVPNGQKLPPSLRNIFAELYNDLGETRLESDLSDWAKNGVLLLNSILTVEAHLPASHKKLGWEIFTNEVIKRISEQKEGLVFVLWGSFAQQKKEFIDTKKHFVLESAHPSPLSAYRGFFGSKIFSKINQILEENQKEKIPWI